MHAIIQRKQAARWFMKRFFRRARLAAADNSAECRTCRRLKQFLCSDFEHVKFDGRRSLALTQKMRAEFLLVASGCRYQGRRPRSLARMGASDYMQLKN